jgi:hypothetical protein
MAQVADIPSKDKIWRACWNVEMGVLLTKFKMEVRQNLKINMALLPQQACGYSNQHVQK